MKTENNIPNSKIIAGAIGGIVSGLIIKFLGEGLTPDMKGYVITLGSAVGFFVVGYIYPPGIGDGTIEK